LKKPYPDFPGFSSGIFIGINSYVFQRGMPNQNNLIYPDPSDGQAICISYTKPTEKTELKIYHISGQTVDFRLTTSELKTTVSFPKQ
jgi:hypothetical protein